jgi:cytoskeletal protein CcmA (bactofilin family)
VLGPGCRFEGRLDLESPARVDGHFEGQIWSSASLRFGPGSVVAGVVRAQSVRLEGSFEGDLYVHGELVVSGGARLNGCVEAAAWSVLTGAQVQAVFRVPKTSRDTEEGSA